MAAIAPIMQQAIAAMAAPTRAQGGLPESSLKYRMPCLSRIPVGALVPMSAALLALLFALPVAASEGQALVTLDALSPLAGRDEIAHRLLSPLARMEYDRAVARQHLEVVDQTIATGEERYDLFVPELPAGSSYGLVVFIAPTEDFKVPADWRGILAREHLILISARRSGNNQNMLGRRVPLALHGHGYATRHYRIDPGRVYVAGFSGGGRTAQLVAFAWPDVFRGVLMFAGSDPFGEGAVAPPPRELMRLVQTRLRIVQSTGMADEVNIAIDGRARRSLAGLCIGNVSHVDQPRLGHGLPRALGFGKALQALLEPATTADDDAGCNAKLQARIDSELADVDRLITAGRQAQARKRLLEVDAHYGWLAAPGSVEAMQRLSGQAAQATPAREARS
jgi:hypothetical protein